MQNQEEQLLESLYNLVASLGGSLHLTTENQEETEEDDEPQESLWFWQLQQEDTAENGQALYYDKQKAAEMFLQEMESRGLYMPPAEPPVVVHVLKADLLRELEQFAKIISKKQYIPVLEHIKLTAENKTLYLTGTDLDVTLQTKIETVKVESEGSFLIPYQKVLALLKSLKKDCELIISCGVKEPGLVTIQIGKLTTKYKSTPRVSGFPDLPETNKFPYWFKASELVRLIEQTQFAMKPKNESSIHCPSAVCLLLDNSNKLKAITTDSHRIASTATENFNLPNGFDYKIDSGTVPVILSLLKQKSVKDTFFGLAILENHLAFEIEKRVLTFRFSTEKLSERSNEYLNFTATKRFMFAAKDMLDVLIKIKPMFEANHSDLFLYFPEDGSNEMKLSISDLDNEVEDFIQYELISGSGSFLIPLSRFYLEDVLKQNQNRYLYFEVTHNRSFIRISVVGDETTRHSIMPLNTKDNPETDVFEKEVISHYGNLEKLAEDARYFREMSSQDPEPTASGWFIDRITLLNIAENHIPKLSVSSIDGIVDLIRENNKDLILIDAQKQAVLEVLGVFPDHESAFADAQKYQYSVKTGKEAEMNPEFYKKLIGTTTTGFAITPKIVLQALAFHKELKEGDEDNEQPETEETSPAAPVAQETASETQVEDPSWVKMDVSHSEDGKPVVDISTESIKHNLQAFKMGDFYEFFGDDAEIVSRITGLTLITKHNELSGVTKMTGFPCHDSGSIIKIVEDGYTITGLDEVSKFVVNSVPQENIENTEDTRFVEPHWIQDDPEIAETLVTSELLQNAPITSQPTPETPKDNNTCFLEIVDQCGDRDKAVKEILIGYCPFGIIDRAAIDRAEEAIKNYSDEEIVFISPNGYHVNCFAVQRAICETELELLIEDNSFDEQPEFINSVRANFIPLFCDDSVEKQFIDFLMKWREENF